MSKIKGEKNGLCNRFECQRPNNVVFFNKSTRAYYCPRCARLINDHNPPGADGKPLCEKDDDDKEATTAGTEGNTAGA